MKVILAEDHNIVREGLKRLLEEDVAIRVIGEAENGKTSIELASKLSPDLILMDISMPVLNGIEATRIIKKKYPNIKILILSMYDNEEYVKETLNAGADGYVLKEALAKSLISAIKIINKGGRYFDDKILKQIAEESYKTQKTGEIKTTFDTLTQKEKEVLKLIGEGLANKEIAGTLSVSVKTVETHRTNIMRKLSIHKHGELVRYAIKKGL